MLQLADILFLIFSLLIVLFTYDIIKTVLKRFLPSQVSFNKEVSKFSQVEIEDDERITADMVGLKFKPYI